jgi:DNA-binding IclR family transcriptional regulator
VEAPRGRAGWPKTLPEQVRAVREALSEQPGPATPEQVARTFQRAQTARVRELLETLESLGQVRRTETGLFAAGWC